MFEEEAKKWVKENTRIEYSASFGEFPIAPSATKSFTAGAEFGYNKANEWHYVKDGDLPKENEYIMIYSKLADNIAVGKRRCAGKIRKRCVYEWYFATYEGTYCLRDKDIIAWKEIVLPKEIKEK